MQAFSWRAAVPYPGGQQVPGLFSGFCLDAPLFRTSYEHRGVEGL